MSLLVDHRQDPALRGGILRRLLHFAEEQIRPGHAQQLPVRSVNRQRAGHAQFPGAMVDFQVGKNQLARFHGLPVPVPVHRVIGHEGTVLPDPFPGGRIRHQGDALRQGEPHVVRFVGRADGDHHIRKIGDQPQPLLRLGGLHPFRQQHLDGHDPVLGCLRPLPGGPGQPVRILQQLPGILPRHPDPDSGVPEHGVRHLGLHAGDPVHKIVLQGVHTGNKGNVVH